MQPEPMLPESENVHLMLLFTGGHQCELSVTPDAPLLRDLFQELANRSHNRVASRLFQIPIDEGRSCLYFPSDSLVAIATDPPVQVQEMRLRSNSRPKQEQLPTEIVESNYVQLHNFLTPAEHNRLIEYVLSKESAFVSSVLDLPNPESFSELIKLLVNRVQAVLPDVMTQLGIPSFPVSEIEAQLMPDNNCDRQKVESDNGLAETATRVLSFIYYFYREPKPFTGGELLIYDSQIDLNVCRQADSFKTVEPHNNSIVFFFSSYAHEVLPVSSPSLALADSCLRFKGWVRR